MEKEVAQRPVKKPIENKPAAVAAPIQPKVTTPVKVTTEEA